MQTERSTLLSVENLHLELGGSRIIKGVSFSIEHGSFVCLIGPNGAAKSTLIKCIDGIYSRYSGRIVWGGKDGKDGRDARKMSKKETARYASYVPQGGMDGITYTAAEFIEMARYPWLDRFSPPTAADATAVATSAELAGVTAHMNRRMDTLSGGERQKVLIASALAQESSLLLLDEPTTYLDYKSSQETLSLVRRINREKKTAVLAVTHDINFALQASDKVIAMNEGTILWEGEPKELLEEGRLENIFGIEFAILSSPGFQNSFYAVPKERVS